MSFSDELKTVLLGGLPALLDSPSAPATKQGDTRPESTAPEPTNRDTEPFIMGAQQVFSPRNVMIGVGAIAILGLVVYLARR